MSPTTFADLILLYKSLLAHFESGSLSRQDFAYQVVGTLSYGILDSDSELYSAVSALGAYELPHEQQPQTWSQDFAKFKEELANY